MKYFLFRLLEQPKSMQTIPIDYLPGDGVNATDGDEFVIFLAGVHTILGVYAKKGDLFVCVEKPIKHVTIKEVMDKLSFVSFVNENTLRMFKKKCREISAADVAMIKEKL